MATKELILNGNFDAGTTDWSFAVDAFIDPSEGIGGTPCAGMKYSPGTEIVQGKIQVIKGAYYDVVLYAKGVTGELFRVSITGTSGVFTASFLSEVVGNEYSKYRYNFQCDDEYVVIHILPVKGSNILYVDDVSLRGTVISFRGDTQIKVREISSGTDLSISAENIQGGLYEVFVPTLGSYVTITNNIQTEPTGTVLAAPTYDPAFQSSANCAAYVNYFMFRRDWKPIYPDYVYTLITDESQPHDVDGQVCLTYGIAELKDYLNSHNVGYQSI